MKEQLMSQLVQFLLGVIGLVATYVLGLLGSYLNAKKQQVVIKQGADNYNRALSIARGLYLVLEDEYKDIEKAGLDKKDEMDDRLIQVIPSLTKAELDSINKTICDEFKKDIVDTLLTPAKEVKTEEKPVETQQTPEVVPQPLNQSNTTVENTETK